MYTGYFGINQNLIAMRTKEKGFPAILTILMALFGITWLMLLLTGSISTMGHLIFVIIAAWFFELFTNTREIAH